MVFTLLGFMVSSFLLGCGHKLADSKTMADSNTKGHNWGFPMGKIPELGSGAIWGTIFIANFEERVAQKLCTDILLHFGQVFVDFIFPIAEKF